MLVRRATLGSDAGAMTMAQASSKVGDAIDFAELAAQQAPRGDAIFNAISNAKTVKASIDDAIPFWSSGDTPAAADVVQRATAAVDAIYDAAAQLQTSGDVPTQFSLPGSVPWGWIAAAAAGLFGVYLFRGGSS